LLLAFPSTLTARLSVARLLCRSHRHRRSTRHLGDVARPGGPDQLAGRGMSFRPASALLPPHTWRSEASILLQDRGPVRRPAGSPDYGSHVVAGASAATAQRMPTLCSA
jgi:hypothetical protein